MMKDLGKLLDLNLDSNQKHIKDPSKEQKHYDDFERGKRPSEKHTARKKPTGVSKRKKLFKKIGKKLNVEKIPGCN